jgi:hypothetical protein
MDMIAAAFNAYLSGDSEREISFLEGYLGIPLPEEKPETKTAGMWPIRAERVTDKAGGRARAERFRSCYAALKGLFLFWIDYKLFEAARDAENPNIYRDRLNSMIRAHCAGDRRKAEMFEEIHRMYGEFAGLFRKYRAHYGPMPRGVYFETDAFLRLTDPDGIGKDPAGETKTGEYFLFCKTAIFNWLDMLQGQAAPDSVRN